MENKIALLDTSVLIDFYRKKDKSKSFLYKLSQNYQSFAVSAITQYEIYVGSPSAQIEFWDDFFSNLTVLPFDSETSKVAVAINAGLKKNNKQIDIPDLFIAATAVMYNLPCATLNKKHFERIEKLELID
ncbi:MAG TPA: type II toxin-antitoxin system VapC family toxin [Mucilaginibacter sp.]|jgi:predicted nucleic acid-binding protein